MRPHQAWHATFGLTLPAGWRYLLTTFTSPKIAPRISR